MKPLPPAGTPLVDLTCRHCKCKEKCGCKCCAKCCTHESECKCEHD